MSEVGFADTFGPSLSSIQAGAMDIIVYLVWGLVILGVVLVAWKKYQDKKIYIYPVRIFRQRNNGMVKEFNTSGGYIKKGAITCFNVKMGKFKKKNMDKLPQSNLMDEDNRIYYWQVSPEAPYIQVKRDFRIESIMVPNENFLEPTKEQRKIFYESWIDKLKEDEEWKDREHDEIKQKAIEIVEEEIELEKNKLVDVTIPTYTPISTDLKQQALADIIQFKNTLGVDINKQFAYFVTGVIALVIVGAVIFYIAVNKGDIPILTEFAPLLFFWKRKSINVS